MTRMKNEGFLRNCTKFFEVFCKLSTLTQNFQYPNPTIRKYDVQYCTPNCFELNKKLPTFHRTQRWWCRYYSKDKYHSEDRWPLGRWRRRWCYPQRLARTKLKYLKFTSYASHLFMGEWVEKEFNIHIIATATGPSYWILHSTFTSDKGVFKSYKDDEDGVKHRERQDEFVEGIIHFLGG